MSCFLLRTVLVIMTLCSVAMTAFGETHKHALVISVSAQERIHALPFANAEAKTIATKLRSMQFDVIESHDGDREAIRAAIREFGQQLKQTKGTGMLYFAGHAIQYKSQNYILPANVTLTTLPEIPDVGVPVNSILEQIEFAGNRPNILILNTGYPTGFDWAQAYDQVGITQMEGPKGSFIGLATQPNTENPLPEHELSLFGEALIGLLDQPGLSIEALFKKIRGELLQSTDNKIAVWQSSSLVDEFYFSKGEGHLVGSGDAADLLAWQKISNSKTVSDFEVFIETYPNSRYLKVAKLKVRQLSRVPVEKKPVYHTVSRSVDSVEKVLEKAYAFLPPYPLTEERLVEAEKYFQVILTMTGTDDPKVITLRKDIVAAYVELAKISEQEHGKPSALALIHKAQDLSPDSKKLRKLAKAYSDKKSWYKF